MNLPTSLSEAVSFMKTLKKDRPFFGSFSIFNCKRRTGSASISYFFSVQITKGEGNG